MHRISNQIIIAIAAFLIITTFLFMWFSKDSILSLGDDVSGIYQTSIRKQAEEFIGRIAEERSDRYDDRFERYLLQAQLQADQGYEQRK